MKNLSLKAYGLLMYLQSNELEIFNIQDILPEFRGGISQVRTAIHELENNGIIYKGFDPNMPKPTKRYFLKNRN